MSKKTRKEKREEERRILAEMDAAMKEQAGENPQTGLEEKPTQEAPKRKRRSWSVEDPTPKKIHCRRCNTLLQEDGYCPTCGYKVYMPMDEKKRNKVRLILTGVFMVVFVVIFVIMQINK